MKVDLIVCHSNGGPEGSWEVIREDIPEHLKGNSEQTVEWLSENIDINIFGDDVVFIGVFDWEPEE